MRITMDLFDSKSLPSINKKYLCLVLETDGRYVFDIVGFSNGAWPHVGVVAWMNLPDEQGLANTFLQNGAVHIPFSFEQECRIDTFSSGRNGQIKVAHIPTGLVEKVSFGDGGTCSSMHAARSLAMAEIVAKIEHEGKCIDCGKLGSLRFDRGLACGVHCDDCFEKTVAQARSQSW